MPEHELVVIEAPFEFPEDTALSLLLLRLIKGQKAWITGSYPLSLLYPFEPNDIDVFCNSKEAEGITKLLQACSYTWEQDAYVESQRKYFDGMRAFKFTHETQPPINLIRSPKFECIQDVWAGFDLSCCEIGIIYDETDECLCLVGSPRFQQFEADEIIDRREPSTPLEQEKMRRRIWKYADRGFELVRCGGDVWKIEPQPSGFIGWGPGGIADTFELDNLPPLTPKD